MLNKNNRLCIIFKTFQSHSNPYKFVIQLYIYIYIPNYIYIYIPNDQNTGTTRTTRMTSCFDVHCSPDQPPHCDRGWGRPANHPRLLPSGLPSPWLAPHTQIRGRAGWPLPMAPPPSPLGPNQPQSGRVNQIPPVNKSWTRLLVLSNRHKYFSNINLTICSTTLINTFFPQT